MRALLVLGGDLPTEDLLKENAGHSDLVIAADRGMEAFLGVGITPDIWVGDMDSVNPAVLAMVEDKLNVLRLPCRKDDTDGEIAVKTAIERGCDDICILGACGGRLDHALGNLALLRYAQLHGAHAEILDERVRIEAVQEELTICGESGDTVSLIPMSTAEGVTLTGFSYPLCDETLYPFETRGISNVLISDTATVQVRQGVVFAFHYYA
ncbi:MAG: thiamine diphosphokinase [Clostridia bacterium]|nr:thiamine diphosphokinase [Clostridia bacterium]